MLELDRIQVAYGAATALWDISLRMTAGELVCVVGPNGAGKTTLINAIAGLNPIVAGTLAMDGRNLKRLPHNQFCDQGIAIVPEGRRLFTGLTVKENLELGSYRRAARANRKESLERVVSIFPVLRERLEAPAGTLSGGQQQMLAIGRALLANPSLLVLDEPSEGLAPVIVDEIADVMRRLADDGTSILLIEQNYGLVRRVAERYYVLSKGVFVEEGALAGLSMESLKRHVAV
jgi:branched-chain amino acid transport system ATP-binding protein